MRNCIAILILLTCSNVLAFEHVVVKGDRLWALSQLYLGSGVKWQQIIYNDGTYPFERDLTIGRTVTVPKTLKIVMDAPAKLSTPNLSSTSNYSQPSKRSKILAPISPIIASTMMVPKGTSLAFNSSFYCCATDVVRMDEYGQFNITPETHPFVAQVKAPVKQIMTSFMNINISEDLFDALKND